jgi:hypothetical protein
MTEPGPAHNRPQTLWLVAILVIACCCLAVVLLAVGFAIFGEENGWFASAVQTFTLTPESGPSVTPLATRTTQLTQLTLEPTVITGQVNTPTPTATLEPTVQPLLSGADLTWQTLHDAVIPINDPIALGKHLAGMDEVPLLLPDLNAPYEVGDVKDFRVTNVDTDRHFDITTTLRYRGDHVYIWIENNVYYDLGDLNALGDAFDQQIYTTNREFFGQEWSPGIDEDPRIHIIYAGGLGDSLAGYFSSSDELHPDLYDFSNAHEMFMINADNAHLWETYTYGTLAHEFQHMIHWYTDKNEETWLNEGFSMLAELINNYDPGNFDADYIFRPDLQLTDWGTEVGENGPHYGAAFLFTTYFLGRFGEDATQAVVAHPMNGMESIDAVLVEQGFTDPVTGEQTTAEDVFADWAVANLVGDANVADGRYSYPIYPDAPTAKPDVLISTCPVDGVIDYTVNQFGVDYIKFTCRGEHTVQFNGNETVQIIPVDPYSGDYFFWSNMGDESNMSLQREFDLTGVTGTVKLTYQAWYDLEKNYDYVYVSASTDGENWQLLESTSCKHDDPSGNNYGCGLNGQSLGWYTEYVNISAYAGQKVILRFDYVTDAAVNGIGMVIDDVAIEAIGYFSDFENDSGGWEGQGFVRIQNSLPQTYRLSLVTYGETVTVTPIELDAKNQTEITFNLENSGDYTVLVISGTTGFTRQKAAYQLSIQ